jgi:caffeoyl-CoA O-methyltransferase
MSFDQVLAKVDAECRRLQIPMLGADKARRLAELIRECKPRLVVEAGTAIGYSGLWIAQTLRELEQGRLITFEKDAERATAAGAYFRQAGLDNRIAQQVGDARELIKEVSEPVDLLFLDCGFANYYPCLRNCRQLYPGSLLVADNAGIGADEMKDYLDHVRKNYQSRTEWFDTDLPWNPRDAMEISRV